MDMSKMYRLIFRTSDFPTLSTNEITCANQCAIILKNLFNSLFGTERVVSLIYGVTNSYGFYGFPIFDYDGSDSEKYYLGALGQKDRGVVSFLIVGIDAGNTTNGYSIIHGGSALNIKSGATSNITTVTGNYGTSQTNKNGFFLFFPVPNGYMIGGFRYTGSDETEKETILKTAVPSDGAFFQKVKGFDGSETTGVVSLGLSTYDNVIYIQDNYIDNLKTNTKQVYPYYVGDSSSSNDRNETVACKIINRSMLSDVYCISLEGCYGTVRDRFALSEYVGSDYPIGEIFEKDDETYLSTFPWMESNGTKKYALLFKKGEYQFPELPIDPTSITFESKSDMSSGSNYPNAVVYNNRIHYISGYGDGSYGGGAHNIFDGNSWTYGAGSPSGGSLTGDIIRAISACTYGDRIHTFRPKTSSTNYHYAWDDTSWELSFDVPTYQYGSYTYFMDIRKCFIFNGDLYIVGWNTSSSPMMYKRRTSDWEYICDIDIDCMKNSNIFRSAFVEYKNEIHLFCGTSSNTYHYKYNGTTFTLIETFSYKFGSACVYKGYIFMFVLDGFNYRVKCYYNNEWVNINQSFSGIYVDFGASMVVYNDKLYIFSSNRTYYIGTL